MSAIIPSSPYLENGIKQHYPKPEKKWDNQAKCYRINGKKVDKNGKPLLEEKDEYSNKKL